MAVSAEFGFGSASERAVGASVHFLELNWTYL